LHDTFPKAALRIRPISTGVIISGYVDDPNQQSRIVEISQNYYPNVINYITVGGVQQVLLQVRVMEVSRTKLRNLGVDFAAILENGSAVGPQRRREFCILTISRPCPGPTRSTPTAARRSSTPRRL
jgi:Flp pilus assembly secretin CpaC